MAIEAPARIFAPLSFKYDPDLPITARREEILAAIQAHQVLIVAGDTGSGKSTQLPQYCLSLGRGRDGLIAHTQPRRLAARALAARIAEELGQPVGRTVGYRVRFADQVSDATQLVLMTDGLLLAALEADPTLSRYDTVIVDEAHERSLNVDLLLGVLKRLLPSRPELKVIVTSATLAVEQMARFFGDAPILRMSGRTYPIETRYAARDDSDDPDLPAAVGAAFLDIATTPGAIGSGDVLVFLPGEREIRDVAEALERELPDVEVLSLYSRLSWEQQRRIFERGTRRRVVLATNVAETSITVPGIRAVIDSGLARISRYSPRNRLQRLPIERISRASADQRKGRCGRIGAGLCIRLYTEDDFAARPEHTEPEILRTNLAALLLRLEADGLGDAESFPFVDAPDSRALTDGYRLLQELQALDTDRRITGRGRAMARLPLDPRLARALLESRRFQAEGELLAIVAGLSVPDVRIATNPLAPGDEPAEAFEDPRSEFMALHRLWRAYRRAREGTRRELRRWCTERRLSLLRLSEWDDVYNQVAERARDLRIVAQRRAASYTAVHRSLLAGFATMVGVRGEEADYLGTRGIRFHILPGSPLRRRKPRWVMGAHIVETSRVYARRVAEVDPVWIEAAAQHLLKREYLEPDWDEEREQVVARERITFLGLTLSANRRVNYGPIAPEEARRIFAREALVYRRLERRPDWLISNDAAIREAELLEERLRIRGLVQPPEYFVDFYDAALPRQVSSSASLEYFTRHLTQPALDALKLGTAQIHARAPDAEVLAQFPETTAVGGLSVAVEYRFAPSEPEDGATLRVPLLALPQLTRAVLDQAIPGLAEPRIVALLRSLPKEVRRGLIPIAATARSFLADLPAQVGGSRADSATLETWLVERRGVPRALVRLEARQLPAHLEPRVCVTDEGQELAAGADLRELRRQLAGAARRRLDHEARLAYPQPWRRFESAELPARAAIAVDGGEIEVYPTLAPAGRALEVRFEWSAAEAESRWYQSAPRLARCVLERHSRDLEKALGGEVPLLLAATPYFTRNEFIDLIVDMAFRGACFEDGPAARTRSGFETAVQGGRAGLHGALEETVALLRGWLAQARVVRGLIDDPRARNRGAGARETEAHLRRLLAAPRLLGLSGEWLRQVTRHLRAEERRWQRVLERGAEPQALLAELEAWQARADALREQASAELRQPPALDEFELWIEEYRVSLYAQELKTLGPISAARLEDRAAAAQACFCR